MSEPFPRPSAAATRRCQVSKTAACCDCRRQPLCGSAAKSRPGRWPLKARLYSENPEPPASVCVCAVKGSPSSARVCYCKSGLCFNTLTLHMDVIFPSRLLRCLLQGRIVLLFFPPSLDLKEDMTWKKNCLIFSPWTMVAFMLVIVDT